MNKIYDYNYLSNNAIGTINVHSGLHRYSVYHMYGLSALHCIIYSSFSYKLIYVSPVNNCIIVFFIHKIKQYSINCGTIIELLLCSTTYLQ